MSSRVGPAAFTAFVALVFGCTVASGGAATSAPAPAGSSDEAVGFLRVPPGFRVTYAAKNIPGARFLAVAPNGDLLVAQTRAGKVVVLPAGASPDSTPQTFMRGLAPHGLAFLNGRLYVAGWAGVTRFDYPSTTGTVLFSNMPQGPDHNARALALASDGTVFVSSGSTCNVCDERDPRFATVLRYAPGDGAGGIYASGLRNASGLAFDSAGRLWATVNQRDNIGPTQAVTDNLPPDEIALITAGGNYGWPKCYPNPGAANRLPNPEYPHADCSATIPAALNLQAHSAPLGITFYHASQFPAQYRGGAFVAFHGSWNRSVPTGDKVVFVRFSGGRPTGYQDFATGWMQPDGSYLGRPVGVAVGPDGSLYISDDKLGVVYRVTYGS